jgi:hypothetical protein
VGVDVGIGVAEVRDRTRPLLCGSLVSRPSLHQHATFNPLNPACFWRDARFSKQVLRQTIYLRTQIDKSRRAGLHSTAPCAPDNPCRCAQCLHSACIATGTPVPPPPPPDVPIEALSYMVSFPSAHLLSQSVVFRVLADHALDSFDTEPNSVLRSASLSP